MDKKKKKAKKKPADINSMAAAIVAEATAGPDIEDKELTEATPEKNPAAVALGRLGGQKGGPARAKKLSPRKRKQIAKKAAEARWGKKKP